MKTTFVAFALASSAFSFAASADGLENLGVVHEQSGTIVQTLQAWQGRDLVSAAVAPMFSGSIGIDFRNCSPVAGTVENSRFAADCSEEAKQKLKLASEGQVSPLLGSVTYLLSESDGRLLDATGACRTIEIRTIIAENFLTSPAFEGIGFSANGQKVFVPKNELHAVGSSRSRSGESVVVHRFIGMGRCRGQGGNSASLQNSRYEFKPYAVFSQDITLGTKEVRRVWEDVATNFSVIDTHQAGSPGASFDRQSELLAPLDTRLFK